MIHLLNNDYTCKICNCKHEYRKGLTVHLKKVHNLTRMEYTRDYLMEPNTKCKCGCGKDVDIRAYKYIEYCNPFWQNRYDKDSEEYKQIIAKTSKSVADYMEKNPKIISEEQKQQQSEFMKKLLSDPEEKARRHAKMTETKRQQSADGTLSSQHFTKKMSEIELYELYKQISEKATETKKERIASGELIPWTRGNSCKNDERMVRMITNNKFKPAYNPKAIPYIEDILNVKYDTQFRHAESEGGEFKIYDKQEGRFYYADAYCEEQNIWVEFDEKCHYLGGQLKQECVFREERVRELLDCMFLRIQFFTDRKYSNH